MNFTGILLFIFLTVAYNTWALLQQTQSPNGKILVISSILIAVGILVFTVFRVQFVFKDGFGQSDLITNWALGLFVGITVASILVTAIFLLEDITRLIQWGVGKLSSEQKEIASRRTFVKNIALGAAAIPVAGTLYGMLKGKYDFRVRRKTIVYPDLPDAFDGFKILQFSDLHSGSYDSMEAIERATALIQEQNADIITFTGDWINAKSSEIVPYKHLFQQLKAPSGKFAVLGNHDYGDHAAWIDPEGHQHIVEAMKNHVQDMEFTALDNDSVKIERNGEYIRLAGVENWGNPPFPRKGNLNLALNGSENDEFTVLLSHDPTHWENEVLSQPRKIHLTLSGHTHGSQVGIDSKWMKWAPVKYVYKYWMDLYQEKDMYLYVNRGLGFIGYAGRVGIPPEITVITLKKGEQV